MFFDRFDRIRRAGWIITARGWKERRYPELISADKKNENGSHWIDLTEVSHSTILSISTFSSSNDASYPTGSDRTTMSADPATGISRVLANSLSRRLNLFRSTIVWPNLPTTTATRACESRESMARTSRCSVRSRLPALFTCSRSDSRVSL